MINDSNSSICFGAGCFWSVEAALQQLDFVRQTRAGYAGGYIREPTYREVCSGLTGHAEVVEVCYNDNPDNLGSLLEVFEMIHDPTFIYREKAKRGSQYRSIILYTEGSQKEILDEWKEKAQRRYVNKIVTELKALENFYEAEERHQNYYKKNPEAPYCSRMIEPKMERIRKKFPKTEKKYFN